VNWKSDLRLSDLDPATSIEIACTRCGKTRYETREQLLEKPELEHAFLDEVERALQCRDRFCRRGVRISLIYDDKNEGFVGGMA
jgi:hypothetical protein